MKEGRGGGADEKVGEGGGVQIFPQRGAFANVPWRRNQEEWISLVLRLFAPWRSGCGQLSTGRDNAARILYI